MKEHHLLSSPLLPSSSSSQAGPESCPLPAAPLPRCPAATPPPQSEFVRACSRQEDQELAKAGRCETKRCKARVGHRPNPHTRRALVPPPHPFPPFLAPLAAIFFSPRLRDRKRKMSLVETVTDVNGVTWGKYVDEADPSSIFYVRSE